MKPEYHTDANAKYLVLRIERMDAKILIPVDMVSRYACDHDHWISDCGRCWDCGSELDELRVRAYHSATFKCLSCGTTTSLPHICPAIYGSTKSEVSRNKAKIRKDRILKALWDLGGLDKGITTGAVAQRTGFNINGLSQTLGRMNTNVDCVGGRGKERKWRLKNTYAGTLR